MKISNKDAKLLYVVGGLLCFGLIYVYGFQPLKEDNAKMLSEIERLKRECETLEVQYAYKDTYETKVAEYRETIKQDLTLFPADIKEEDIVAYILNLQEANDIEVSSIGFQEPVELINFVGVREVDGIDLATRMIGKKISAAANVEMTYEELKNLLQYIYDTETQTTLEKITLSYNSEEETLSGSMNFARYILNYEEAEYIPEELPEVEIGQEDPFGED